MRVLLANQSRRNILNEYINPFNEHSLIALGDYAIFSLFLSDHNSLVVCTLMQLANPLLHHK